MASIYHAFDTHPGAAGCTVLAAFEEGEVRMDGWIPTTLTLGCRPERVAAVTALLDRAAPPAVSLDPDRRAVLVLQGNRDRRAAYLEMGQTTLQQVLDAAQGRRDATDLGNARHATAAALAAEVAVVSRGWVQVGADGPLEATG